VTHWSWVTWVMGQELSGSLGSWVTLSDPFPALIGPHSGSFFFLLLSSFFSLSRCRWNVYHCSTHVTLVRICNAGLKYAARGLLKLKHAKNRQLQCGPISNVMAALPNIGGALCQSSVIPFLVPCSKVWLTPAAGVPCSNAANIAEPKTWT